MGLADELLMRGDESEAQVAIDTALVTQSAVKSKVVLLSAIFKMTCEKVASAGMN